MGAHKSLNEMRAHKILHGGTVLFMSYILQSNQEEHSPCPQRAQRQVAAAERRAHYIIAQLHALSSCRGEGIRTGSIERHAVASRTIMCFCFRRSKSVYEAIFAKPSHAIILLIIYYRMLI